MWNLAHESFQFIQNTKNVKKEQEKRDCFRLKATEKRLRGRTTKCHNGPFLYTLIEETT